jgi:branched-subunit amino acid ABC-type transport system permease component
VWSLWWLAGHDVAVADSATFAASGQMAALAAVAAAVIVLVARRDRFATLEVAR